MIKRIISWLTGDHKWISLSILWLLSTGLAVGLSMAYWPLSEEGWRVLRPVVAVLTIIAWCLLFMLYRLPRSKKWLQTVRQSPEDILANARLSRWHIAWLYVKNMGVLGRCRVYRYVGRMPCAHGIH